MKKLISYSIAISGGILWFACVALASYPHDIPNWLGITNAILLLLSCLMIGFGLTLIAEYKHHSDRKGM